MLTAVGSVRRVGVKCQDLLQVLYKAHLDGAHRRAIEEVSPGGAGAGAWHLALGALTRTLSLSEGALPRRWRAVS